MFGEERHADSLDDIVGELAIDETLYALEVRKVILLIVNGFVAAH